VPAGRPIHPIVVGGIISERWATSSRSGGRHHFGTSGGIIPEQWATSPGFLTLRKTLASLRSTFHGCNSPSRLPNCLRVTPGRSIVGVDKFAIDPLHMLMRISECFVEIARLLALFSLCSDYRTQIRKDPSSRCPIAESSPVSESSPTSRRSGAPSAVFVLAIYALWKS
jgi:hypothetical protein